MSVIAESRISGSGRMLCSGIAAMAVLPLLSPPASPAERRRPVLLVGSARIDITPDRPVALSGYPDPEGRVSEGVHDRLYARAVAFVSGPKKLVLVSCDLSGFQYTGAYYFQKEIYAQSGLEPDELFLCGTHTHSGPMLFLNRTYPHPNNSLYTEGLRARLAAAVAAALKSAAPARLAAGSGRSEIAFNRRLPLPEAEIQPGGSRVKMAPNPGGPADREVQVLKIARTDGTPVVALFDYACHSRSLRGGNRLVSGDIFGIAAQHVENALGAGVISPAFAGASGDVDPREVVSRFESRDGRPPVTVEMGTALGEEVVRVFGSALELPPAGGIRTIRERLAVPGKTPGGPADTAGPVRHVEISAAAVGEVAFVGLDCEAFVEIGKEIKARSPFRHTFVLTHCNGGSGYLPVAGAYPDRGYEVNLSGFAPAAAGMVVNRVIGMLGSIR